MPTTMLAKTPEIFDYLKGCAAEGRTASYSEIARKFGLPDPRDVVPYLNEIRDKICTPQGLPWITTLVVNASTRLPGPGWFPYDTETPNDNMPIFLGDMVHRVLATDWSKIEIES